MTFGSLFSGAGGFDLGFHQAGFNCLWVAEIDRRSSNVLAKLGAPNLGDVRQIDGDNIDVPDVVVWGSPCQDFSSANVHSVGLTGNKSSLFYEGTRIIKSLSMRGLEFSIWENVARAIGKNGGEDFRAVLQTFLDIGARSIAWRVLDGKNFGVPQSRRRVFVVADFRGDRAGEVLCDAKASRLHVEPCEEDEMDLQRGGIHGALTCGSPSRWGRPDNVIHPCILARHPYDTPHPPLGVVLGSGNNVYGALTTTRPQDCGMRNKWTSSEIIVKDRLRWRTPLESERLMGWSDDWTRFGEDGAEMSDTARYFMTGNGVIMPLAYWLAVGVREALQHDRNVKIVRGEPVEVP